MSVVASAILGLFAGATPAAHGATNFVSQKRIALAKNRDALLDVAESHDGMPRKKAKGEPFSRESVAQKSVMASRSGRAASGVFRVL
tara:strand:- start:130465 stop:130725 length:261 start_codon:yes stop_codon:yes gene_type:complete